MRLIDVATGIPGSTFEEAVFASQPKSGSLFLPERISVLSKDFWNVFPQMPFAELAFQIARSLLEDEIPDAQLKTIVEASVTFDTPLVSISEGLYVLELFHGPTLSFKDIGARFLAQVLSYYSTARPPVTVLVATSGDTGSAVANAFYRVPHTRVIILYPKGKVSPVQEQQFATLGDNILSLEVVGNFDDCQRLVKMALGDAILRNRLTSANSINIGRLIAQLFYYFRAYQQLSEDADDIVVSVPCGNFGNLTAGLMARKMGLPVTKFIAATNSNDVVPRFLQTGKFEPIASRQTISNSMDVGNPSNFTRVRHLCNNSLEEMNQVIFGSSHSDAETKEAIVSVLENYGYTLDPHAAVAYQGLRRFSREWWNPRQGILLATAHPAKFLEVVEQAIGKKLEMPDRLKQFRDKEKKSISMTNDYAEFQRLLIRETSG